MCVWITFLVTAAVVGYLPTSIVAICDGFQAINYVNFPQDKHVLSMEDFMYHMADRDFTEMYYALPVPPKYTPDINFSSRITHINGTLDYYQHTIAETPEANPRCVRENHILKHIPGTRAIFLFNNTPKGIVFWSSCPSQYIWTMRCNNYGHRKQKCFFSETDIGLLLSGSLNDVPMLTIVQDLCKVTNVHFGDRHYNWTFTYGNTTSC